MLDERPENAADDAFLPADLQRGAQLTQDLLLAHDHRVEAARDREQVLHRTVLVVHVEVVGELVERDAGALDESLGDLLHTAVELARVGVELEPVARREDDRLVDVFRGDRMREQFADVLRGKRGALEQLDRGRAVRQADHKNTHAGTTADRTSSGTAAPGEPATPDALRCSWKARICS